MPLTAPPITVLQLTDCHILAEAKKTMMGVDTEKYFLKVLAQAFADHAQFDLLMLTGDLAQDTCISSYQRLQQHLLALPIPVLCLPGNHDDLGLMQKLLNQDNLSCDKQRILGNWQIICLNSQIEGQPGGFLSKNELTYLKLALQAHPGHYALIALHHHCTPTNSSWMDSMIVSNSNDLFSVLQDYPQAKVIITGHIHQELEQQAGHLQIFGTPSTCFQFTPNSRHFSVDRTAPGYRILKLYSDGSLTTAVNRLPDGLRELTLDGKGYLVKH